MNYEQFINLFKPSFIGVNTSQLCCGVTLEKASSVDDSTSNIKATVPPRQYSVSSAAEMAGIGGLFYLTINLWIL